MFSYTNLIRPKPCNYLPCNRSPMKAHFTYMFPRWLASRALIASCVVDNLTGSTAGWAIRVPTIIPSYHLVWQAIMDGNLAFLKSLFSNGEATPTVVDQYSNTLLHVSLAQYRGFGYYPREWEYLRKIRLPI